MLSIYRIFHLKKRIPRIPSWLPYVFFKEKTRVFSGQLASRGMSSFLKDSTNKLTDQTSFETLIPSESNVIWIDMEMTGLDPEKDTILEVACLITDRLNNIIAEGPNLIIHQPLEILNSMNEWCLTHHTQSGLFKESLESQLSLEQAEDEVLKFVQQYTPKGKCCLAGNSVYMDKFFLMKYMPRIAEHLHYRILDVSAIKILAKNWYNLDPPHKVFRHRALDDIKESIQELLYYQRMIFKPILSNVKETSKEPATD